MPRQRKGDWVIAGGKPGELAYCTRCGEGLSINLPQRLGVITGAMNAFGKAHLKCREGAYIPKPPLSPEEWAHGRDTGTSSLTIYAAITGNPNPHRRFDAPHDPDDFGRCYRLLKLFPTWKRELAKTARICPTWKPFVEAWEELTDLYEKELPSGTAPRLYARIQQLRGVNA